jgi:hypothetical protein
VREDPDIARVERQLTTHLASVRMH